MIPTLRWALLKNSGLRSMGMGRVALLLDGTSGRTEVTKSHIFRDACSPVTFIQASQRESRAIGQRQVNITGSPKNQKMLACLVRRGWPLSRLPPASGPEKIAESAATGRSESVRRAGVSMPLIILLLGLGVGVLVGLLGIGGGVVLVPAMVYLLGMDQHLAQGTSLFILLPPIGLGALREYWKQGQVDLRPGTLCALGMLLGAYGGSLVALPLASRHLKGLFGCFLVLSAILLWRKGQLEDGFAAAKGESARG